MVGGAEMRDKQGTVGRKERGEASGGTERVRGVAETLIESDEVELSVARHPGLEVVLLKLVEWSRASECAGAAKTLGGDVNPEVARKCGWIEQRGEATSATSQVEQPGLGMRRADQRDKDFVAWQFIGTEKMVPGTGRILLVERGRWDGLPETGAVPVKPETEATEDAGQQRRGVGAHEDWSKKNSSAESKLAAKPGGRTGCDHGGVGVVWET